MFDAMAVSLDSCSDFEDVDVDDLTEQFNKAADHVKKLVSGLDQAKLLEIYSFYKQATEGACKTAKPSWYEMQAKAKWEAWRRLGDLDPKQAKARYVQIISELDPNFASTTKSESWVSVSCPVNCDLIINESDKTAFDHAKDGDLSKLTSSLATLPDVNVRDENGLGLIHWAADRGFLHILKFLTNNKANLNLTDNDGQTALHYASSCDHIECVRFLIDVGADVNIKDSDGMLPVDLANNSDIVQLLQK